MAKAKRVRRFGLEPNEGCPDDHDLAVWFTPDAIRDHDEKGTEGIPTERLSEAARYVLENDRTLWGTFHLLCEEIIARAKAAKGGSP